MFVSFVSTFLYIILRLNCTPWSYTNHTSWIERKLCGRSCAICLFCKLNEQRNKARIEEIISAKLVCVGTQHQRLCCFRLFYSHRLSNLWAQEGLKIKNVLLVVQNQLHIKEWMAAGTFACIVRNSMECIVKKKCGACSHEQHKKRLQKKKGEEQEKKRAKGKGVEANKLKKWAK